MKWFLTQKVAGEPEISVHDDDEDLTLGYSLMSMLAEDAGSGFYEVADGMWLCPKEPGDGHLL